MAYRRMHAAAAANDIAVPHGRESDISIADIGVRRKHQLLHGQLRRAIEIDGVHSFVGGDGDDTPNATLECCFDDILCAQDVRPDGLERVLFKRGNLLQRGGMHHVVDAVERPEQPFLVTHIPQKVANGVGAHRPSLGHLVLLELVATEHDDLAH